LAGDHQHYLTDGSSVDHHDRVWTLLAVLYDRKFFGKNVATLLVIAPFFIMPTSAR